MHEYRGSTISRLMLKVDLCVSDVDLYIAQKMVAMAGIESIPGGGSLAGRSLVLGVGQSPFACALGSRNYGHEVVGIAFHASNVHQQNFFRNRLGSRARFLYSTVGTLPLAMPVFTWDFVFVLPYADWNKISDYVLDKMPENCKIVVAQRFSMDVDLEDYEHEFFRVTDRGYCHPATEEEGEWVIFKVR